MSCPNNCNNNCNCNNCCPPSPPPTPPVPPRCEGTNCTELYDGACVEYTGPAISCLGINSGNSLNAIVQIFADQLCNCSAGPKCKNPLEFLFEYLANLAIAFPAKTQTTIISDVLGRGFIVPTCGLCCPDTEIWSMGSNTSKNTMLALIDRKYNIGVNTNIGYDACVKTFMTATNPTIVPPAAPVLLYASQITGYGNIQEIGSILGDSQICTVFDFCQKYKLTPTVAKAVFDYIMTNGIVVSCIGKNSELFIGTTSTFTTYYNTTTANCA